LSQVIEDNRALLRAKYEEAICFQMFENCIPHTDKNTGIRCPQVIEDNRALLRAKYEEAKELGARAGGAKAAISAAKAQLEQLRAQRAVAGEGAG
jgi:hypothetical protein